MDKTFELKKGQLVFNEDKIVLTDNAKIYRGIRLFISTSMIISVLTLVIAYFTTGDQYETWLGFFIGIAVILAFVVSPFTSVQNEIDLKEVKTMKMKLGLFNEYLEIRLTNNKIRSVSAIVDKEGLREYIDKNLLPKPIFESNTFELKKGKIVFEEEKIVITDNACSQRSFRLFGSVMWMIFGTLSVLRFLKTGDHFLLWTGLLIGIGHLVVVVLNLLKSVQSEISLNEVKSMKIKKRAGNEFLDIDLHNNRTRRVTEIFNTDRLEEYIKTISLPL